MKTSKYAPIRAFVSQALLGRADRLFKGDIRTVITELVQNSRRARATEISVTAVLVKDKYRIAFADNGHGCADPLSLIALAQTDWQPDVEASEDPGGCGFFSILGLGLNTPVEVRSRDWHMTLTRDSMMGVREVTPVEAPEIPGLLIDFFAPAPAGHGIDILQTLVFERALFSGMRVVFNGTVQEPSDFLEGCQRVVEYRGVRIGISETMQIPRDAHSSMRHHYYTRAVNFFGCRPMPPVASDATLEEWGEDTHCIYIRLDIHNAQSAPMTLPQREAVQDTPVFADIMRRARIEAVTYALERWRGVHSMAFKKRQALALETGLDIPEAARKLRLWTFRKTDFPENQWPDDICGSGQITSSPSSRLVRVHEHRDLRALHILLALTNAGDKPLTRALTDIVLVDAIHGYEGYAWYDEITDIDEITVEVSENPRGSTARVWLKLEEERSDAIASEEQNIIELKLRMTSSKWRDKIVLPLPMLIRADDSSDASSNTLVAPMVSKSWFHAGGNPDHVSLVEDLLFKASWTGYSDTGDAEREEEEAHANVRQCVRLALFGPRALLEMLAQKWVMEGHWDMKLAAMSAGVASIDLSITMPDNVHAPASWEINYNPRRKKTPKKKDLKK